MEAFVSAVGVVGVSGDPLQEQATITQMMETVLESGVCDCFTNWGIIPGIDHTCSQKPPDLRW
jgi:hypothetical protein